jgi:hypothetical protein
MEFSQEDRQQLMDYMAGLPDEALDQEEADDD